MIDLSVEFPQDPAITYLNHAALGPWPRRCSEAINRFAELNRVRGATDYGHWIETEKQTRERLRWLINAPSPNDIALLKNTTEALCVVAWGLDWRDGDSVLIGAQEFPSNRLPWRALKRRGVICREVDLYQNDDPEQALIDAMDATTRLLSISAVQYDTGLTLDLKRLGAACRERDVLFCVDAIQSLGALPMDVQSIGAHFVAADAHKWLLAPEAIALFYCATEVRESLRLYQQGWRMCDDFFDFDRDNWDPSPSARRFEAGSLNTLGMCGLNATLSLFQEIGLDQVSRRLRRNGSILHEGIGELKGATLRTPADPKRRAGIVTFEPGSTDRRTVQRQLVDQGFICSVRGGVRLAPGFYQDEAAMHRTVEAIAQLLDT